MSEDYFSIGIVSAASTIFTAVGVVLGFKPRINRAESDIQKLDKDKADKTTITALEHLMETQFTSQGREIKEIKEGVKTLLERREAHRQNNDRDK